MMQFNGGRIALYLISNTQVPAHGAHNTRFAKAHLERIHPKLDVCVEQAKQQGTSASDMLRECMAKTRRTPAQIVFCDDTLPPEVLQLLPGIRSMLDFGSGRGDYLRTYTTNGVEYAVGIQPGYLGTLGFYASGWDARSGPVQLGTLWPEGVADLKKLKCVLFGDAERKFDLIQSLEVFEHIPRNAHCELLNLLATQAGRWVVFGQASIGQAGYKHITNRHRRDMWLEWLIRGFKPRDDVSKTLLASTNRPRMHFRHNIVVFEAPAPEDLKLVDCAAEVPVLDWLPFEDYDSHRLRMPNMTKYTKN